MADRGRSNYEPVRGTAYLKDRLAAPLTLLAIITFCTLASLLGTARPADAASLPSGFQEEIVFSGLTQPTSVRFSPDGRVFVAEKSGLIKVFDNLTDKTPRYSSTCGRRFTTTGTAACSDMALAPNFPTDPWVYVLYTYDAPIGGVAPTGDQWAAPSRWSLTPPGPTDDGRRLRSPVADTGFRQRCDRPGAGPDRGVVPAVPEPLDREPGVRTRRRALREWR